MTSVELLYQLWTAYIQTYCYMWEKTFYLSYCRVFYYLQPHAVSYSNHPIHQLILQSLQQAIVNLPTSLLVQITSVILIQATTIVHLEYCDSHLTGNLTCFLVLLQCIPHIASRVIKKQNSLSKLGVKENYLNLIKSIYKNHTLTSHLMVKSQMHSP